MKRRPPAEGYDLVLLLTLEQLCRRYPDGCYAVSLSGGRGPCGHDKPTAVKRFLKSGFIAFATTDKRKRRPR